ncbi:MAG TPA: ferredoxin--NADP reductase [Agriterribacter sp.]|nr:ferredoxin--NADP reductase [Agriterribacter sp.]
MVQRSLLFRIVKVIPETEDTSTFVLEETSRAPIPYKSGQFLTFIFESHGKELRRSYSLSSTPGIDEYLSITVKRVHNGAISRNLLDHYHEGDLLKALAPSGMFVLDEHTEAKKTIFLLAAGSGITPVYSLLKSIVHRERGSSVILIYQNHARRSTIFRNALELMAAQFPDRFTWIDLVSTPNSHNPTSQRLNNEQLERIIAEQIQTEGANARFFICGPPSFMRMCQYTILLMGFKPWQVRKEYFVIDEPPLPPLLPEAKQRRVIVYTSKQKIMFVAQYPKTILQSALDQNIPLPYSCRGGKCSTCVAKCASGKVEMSINDVLTDADLAQGLILTCVGYAVTDIELIFGEGDKVNIEH